MNFTCASFFLACLCTNPQQVGIAAVNLRSPAHMALLHALRERYMDQISSPCHTDQDAGHWNQHVFRLSASTKKQCFHPELYLTPTVSSHNVVF